MVKRIVFMVVISAAIVGGVWLVSAVAADEKPAPDKAAGEKPAAEEASGVKISHDEVGNVILKVSPKTAELIGLKTAHPNGVQLRSEIKGHGQAMDPAPLVALLTEVETAEAAAAVSSNELARLKTLSTQGNASARALQAAESTELHDRLAAQSARDRLALSWGRILESQPDIHVLVHALTSLDVVLVRIDLPAGEIMSSAPVGARVVALSGTDADAEYLGAAPNVDPQTQGQGFIFLVRIHGTPFLPGAALVGYVQRDNQLLNGVIVPADAVVRTEGAGWIYVQHGGPDEFLRMKISLDHPAMSGWFVTTGVTAADAVVVTGAQSLLSEESKGLLKSD
jgi:multidrug efflux pump subunit AcrA (membrane-fusion protein)